MNTTCMGIDPDLRLLACAWVGEQEDGLVVPQGLVVRHVNGDGTRGLDLVNRAIAAISEFPLPWGFASAYVESQQAYDKGKNKRVDPNDLIHLASVSGSWMGRLGTRCRLVLPSTWKGTTPKKIAQARTWKHLGIPAKQTTNGSVPTVDLQTVLGVYDVDKKLTRLEMSDVADSFGLALYAHRQYKLSVSRRS